VRITLAIAVLLSAAAIGAGSAFAQERSNTQDQSQPLAVDPSLSEPDKPTIATQRMDAAVGRKLFVAKGCVVCHSINGVGGNAIRDLGGKPAPSLDAARMPASKDVFEFFARMWRGAEPMIALQREQLGYMIRLEADELANIMAFVYDAEEQRKLTPDSYIPPIFWYRDVVEDAQPK